MQRWLLAIAGLVFVLLLFPVFSGVAQQPEPRFSLGDELKVGKRFYVVPVGSGFRDESILVEVVAIDKGWVKVIHLNQSPRYVWINLHQLIAIRSTEKVKDVKPIGGDR